MRSKLSLCARHRQHEKVNGTQRSTATMNHALSRPLEQKDNCKPFQYIYVDVECGLIHITHTPTQHCKNIM